jgi:hypothetical protein
MPIDALLAEIHAIREAIAKESDDDLRRIVEAARLRQKQGGREVVDLPPRPAQTLQKAS